MTDDQITRLRALTQVDADPVRVSRADLADMLDALDDARTRLERVEEIRRRACEILGARVHESLTEAAARVVQERNCDAAALRHVGAVLRAVEGETVPKAAGRVMWDRHALAFARDTARAWKAILSRALDDAAAQGIVAPEAAAQVYEEAARLNAGPRDADGREVPDTGALHPTQGEV